MFVLKCHLLQTTWNSFSQDTNQKQLSPSIPIVHRVFPSRRLEQRGKLTVSETLTVKIVISSRSFSRKMSASRTADFLNKKLRAFLRKAARSEKRRLENFRREIVLLVCVLSKFARLLSLPKTELREKLPQEHQQMAQIQWLWSTMKYKPLSY